MVADPARLQFEIFKLLLQAAWADHEIQEPERKMLSRYARNFAYTPAELEDVEGYLSGQVPLPPPNMAILKQHRAEVVRIVESLLRSDDHFAVEEREILADIDALLS